MKSAHCSTGGHNEYQRHNVQCTFSNSYPQSGSVSPELPKNGDQHHRMGLCDSGRTTYFP